MDWDKPNTAKNQGRELYTDESVVAPFEGIRRHFKDVKSLTKLSILDGFPGFVEIGRAIMHEKGTGHSFDVGELWKSLTPHRVYGSGYGHAFPHPMFTGVHNTDPAEFWEWRNDPIGYQGRRAALTAQAGPQPDFTMI